MPLAADDHLAAAAVLLVIGGVSWFGLGYLVPPPLPGHGLAFPVRPAALTPGYSGLHGRWWRARR